MVDLMVDIVANMLDNRGSSNSNWGSMGNSNRGSMGNSSDSRGSNSMSSSIDSSYKTMSKKTMTVGTGNETSISISFSNRGSKATGNNSGENNKALHLVFEYRLHSPC